MAQLYMPNNVVTPAAVDPSNQLGLITFDPPSGTMYIGANSAVFNLTENILRSGSWNVALIGANATDLSSFTIDFNGISVKTNNNGNAVRISDQNANITGLSLTSLSTLDVNAGQMHVDNSGNVSCLSINPSGSLNVGSPVAGQSFMCSASAVLDFPSTATGAASTLTMTCTGAAVGDSVALGIPNAAMVAGAIAWFGWVSAVNTVSIRFSNFSGGALDPASATFRCCVIR